MENIQLTGGRLKMQTVRAAQPLKQVENTLILIGPASATGLPRDPDLSSKSEMQARELATKMQSLTRPGSLLIYSSPAFRCLKTAAPIAEAFSTPLIVEAGLSSWYITKGEHPSRATAAHLPRFFPRCHVDVHQTLLAPPRGGESVDALHRRAGELLKGLIPKLQHQAGRHKMDLLLICHAPCAIALARMLTGNASLHLTLGFASLTVFEQTAHADDPLKGWTMEEAGETSFLSGGLQAPWVLKPANDPPSPLSPSEAS